jgi:hypothetical protein
MEYLVKLNDAGMSDEFEDVNLPGDPLHVGNIDYLLLHQYLDGYFLTRQRVRRQLNFPERTLPYRLTQQVVPYLLLLLSLLSHLCYNNSKNIKR